MFSSRLEIWSYQPVSHQYYIMSKLQLVSLNENLILTKCWSGPNCHALSHICSNPISQLRNWFLYHQAVLFLSYNKHIAKPLTVSNWGHWRNQSSQNTCNFHMLHQTNLLTNTTGLHPTFLNGVHSAQLYEQCPWHKLDCMEWWMPRLTSLVYIWHSNWPHAELSE